MPSKGGSRTSSGVVRGTAAAAPVSTFLADVMGPAVAAWNVGNVVDDEPPSQTPEWAEMYAAAVARYRQDRERLDREAEEAGRLWNEFLRLEEGQVPEGERSLVANDELHRQLLELARTSGGEYERSNVIGDPNQTFGIELEFDGADPNAVAHALYDAGLAAAPSQQGYQSPRQPGKWVVERDATVTGEVVSPVLRDTPETWEQLERVCQILREHGARTTTRTGGHVHVGVDSAGLDHDVNRFRRVAQVCAWAEDLMYRLAAAGGRGGRRHRGASNAYRWCGPMGSGRFEEAHGLSELAHQVGSSHSVGLNFANILDQRRTIEYRYFDSSLDPARLQANVKVACWVTRRAAEIPDSAIPRERHRLGSHRGSPDQQRDEGLLRQFADLVFVRPKDKLRLYWLYRRSEWQALSQRAA